MANINLRVTDEQKAELECAAKACGLKLSDWLRRQLQLTDEPPDPDDRNGEA